MKLSNIDSHHVNNNFCKIVAIETSHCRVSSCINSTSLAKAILFRTTTKMEKTLDNLGIAGFVSI